MNITILGGTGQTGAQIVRQALQQGHQVVVLARTPDSLDRTDPNLTVIAGDATEEADVAKAFAGAGAVISTLGGKASDLIQRSTRAIVNAAQDTGVERVVMMSSFLVAPNFRPGVGGRLVRLMLKSGLDDKSAGEPILTSSELNWTIVYPTQLDKTPAGSPVRIAGPDDTVSTNNSIARADVAAFLLSEVTTVGHPRSKVVITSK